MAGAEPPAPRSGSRGRLGARRWGRRLGVFLAAAGLLLVVIPGSQIAYGIWRVNQMTQQWQREVNNTPQALSVAPPISDYTGPAAKAPAPKTEAAVKRSYSLPFPVVFSMKIPKLNYVSAVVQGVNLPQLAVGPGHYVGTMMPGEPGVVGIAAHNVFWLRFDQLQPGDRIILQTLKGTYTYQVTGTTIVVPSDTSVFDQGPGYHLTLTTCWPLWAGALATRRFVIFATQISPAPPSA